MRITRLDFDGFSTIRDEWNRLLENSGSNSIFLRWEWAYAWWNIFRDKRKKLYLLTAHDTEGRLLGIAPCYVTYGRTLKLLRIREMRFLGYSDNDSESVSPEYLDFITAPRERSEMIADFFAYFLNNRTDWDVLHLTDLLESSAVLQYAKGLHRDIGLRLTQAESACCPYASLPDSWDAYINSLSKNMRYNIGRKVRKLERDFKVNFYCWSDADEIEFAMRKLADLHVRRWERHTARHSFSTDTFNDFHTRIAKEFHDLGLLRLYVLEVDGQIVAMLYCFKYADKLFYYQGGFDPEYSRYSVGTALFTYVMKEAIRERIREFDFLRGDHKYKFDWASETRKTVKLAIMRNTLAGNAYFLMNVFLGRTVKDYLRRYLPSEAYRFMKSLKNRFLVQE